jgi:hypothetical protein
VNCGVQSSNLALNSPLGSGFRQVLPPLITPVLDTCGRFSLPVNETPSPRLEKRTGICLCKCVAGFSQFVAGDSFGGSGQDFMYFGWTMFGASPKGSQHSFGFKLHNVDIDKLGIGTAGSGTCGTIGG